MCYNKFSVVRFFFFLFLSVVRILGKVPWKTHKRYSTVLEHRTTYSLAQLNHSFQVLIFKTKMLILFSSALNLSHPNESKMKLLVILMLKL